MQNDIQIPRWLRERFKEQQPEQESAGRTTLLMITASVSIYTALALIAPDPQNNDPGDTKQTRAAVLPAPKADPVPQVEPVTDEELNSTIPSAVLTEQEVLEQAEELQMIYRHALHERTLPGSSCDNTGGYFDAKRMARPDRFNTTRCYADSAYDLYKKSGNTRFQRLSRYFYRHCLYLIEGQLEGKFRKPRGGNRQIMMRRDEVVSAMERVTQGKEQ